MKQCRVAIVVFCVLFITGIKLWLFSALSIGIDANAPHDDSLFIKQAASILEGNWLGPYDNLTLAKGVGYSLFIVAAHTLHIPLLTAEQLFYAVACLLASGLVWFMTKKKRAWVFVVVYAVLFFNPFSFDGNLNLRINRPAIYYSLSTMTLCSFALSFLVSRQKHPTRMQYVFAVVGGVLLAASWITREESIWLVIPTILLVLKMMGPHDQQRMRHAIITMSLAFGGFCLGILPIAIANHTQYGQYILTEYQHPAFIAAYGALTRVVPKTFTPYVPVPKETRLEIAKVSPTFRKIDGQLEGYIAKNWEAVTKAEAPLPNGVSDIGGGWFMWAFRDAVSDAGFYQSLPQALTAYNAVADEINTACNQRLLLCTPKRNTFIPPIRSEYVPNFLWFTGDLIKQILTFHNLHFFYDAIDQPTQQYLLSQTITLEYPHAVNWQDIRIRIMTAILCVYRLLLTPSIMFACYRLVILIKRRNSWNAPIFYVIFCLLISICILSGIIVTLASVSLPIAIFSGYFGPILPIAFIVLLTIFFME